MPELAYLTIKIDRDSVHPADDIFSHEKTIEFPAAGTLLEFLQLVNQPPYLPGISGDQATWIVDLLGPQENCLGVVTQQWQQPKLTVPLTTPIADLITSPQSTFFFRYGARQTRKRFFLPFATTPPCQIGMGGICSFFTTPLPSKSKMRPPFLEGAQRLKTCLAHPRRQCMNC